MFKMKMEWKLIPLLLLYLVVILLIADNQLVNDELRYRMFAENLSGVLLPTPGCQSLERTRISSDSCSLVLLRLPLIFARLLNAFFLFGAVLYFYETLKLYAAKRRAFYCSFLFGLFLPFWVTFICC